MINKLLFILAFSITSILSFSQAEDSLFSDTTNFEPEFIPKPKKQEPDYLKKVTRWSLLPGAGQIYNKKFHKAPIFLTGMALTTRSWYLNHVDYRFKLKNLNNLFDDLPSTTNESGVDSLNLPETLKELNTFRGLSLFGTGLIYALSIADARMDANIKLFPNEDHRPKKTAFASAMVPGLGQIMNKKYWKLPIIYGGAYYLFYNYNLYDEQFDLFNTSYTQKANDLEVTYEAHKLAPTSTLLQFREKYRKKKESMMIFGAILYAANIIDATVDAHLRDFNIDDSIDLTFIPMRINNTNGMGMNLAFTF